MKTILVVIMILLSSSTYAQDKRKIIELKNESTDITLKDFYISAVIDGRQNKDNIGFALVGKFNKKVIVDLEEGLAKSVYDYFTKSYSFDSNSTPVVLKIVQLNISEDRGLSTNKGIAKVQIEFYKSTNGQFGKVFESEAFIKQANIDVKSGHEKLIRSVLATCIEDFNNSNWKLVTPDFKEAEVVFAEKTEISEPQFSDKNQEEIQYNNVFSFNPSFGIYAAGWGLTYYRFSNIEKSDWIIPFMLSIESFYLNTATTGYTGYQKAKLNFSMPGISAFKKLAGGAYVNLTLLIPVGHETLTSEGRESENFFIGVASSQGILFIPKSNSGITIGFGIYQRLLTSKVYKKDFGVRAEIGLKF
jgi:hypothetical protein